MKELLLKVVSNSAVRKAFVALVMAVLAALGFSFATGCASYQLPPSVERDLAIVQCQVMGVAEVLGGNQERAIALFEAMRSRDARTISVVIEALQLTLEQAESVDAVLRSCVAEAGAGGVEPTVPRDS